MHAVTIHRQKFLSREAAEKRLEILEEEDRQYGPEVYTRYLVDNTVVQLTYGEVYPYQLDNMFEQQVDSMDNKLATGSAKRRGKNGYDPGLTDYDEDDE